MLRTLSNSKSRSIEGPTEIKSRSSRLVFIEKLLDKALHALYSGTSLNKTSEQIKEIRQMLNTRNPAVLATLALFWAMPTIAQTALSTTSVTHEAALAGQKAGKTTMKFESATPNLIVSDIERSTAFYRDVLGFEQLRTVPDKAPFVFVWMKQD